MITGAVFPHSFGGMVGAVMLGLGRAMGETIAVALVIGAATQITANLFAGGDAHARGHRPAVRRVDRDFTAALIGLGVVLFAMTIVVNLPARLVVRPRRDPR